MIAFVVNDPLTIVIACDAHGLGSRFVWTVKKCRRRIVWGRCREIPALVLREGAAGRKSLERTRM
jgi:hypothetical protein